MKIAEIRSVIDSLNWNRHDLSGATREEFLREDVPARLGRHIEACRALEIPARFARDIASRDSAIEYAERTIARWRDGQPKPAPAAPMPAPAPVLRLVAPAPAVDHKARAATLATALDEAESANRELRALLDEKNAKILALQAELGQAEAALKIAGGAINAAVAPEKRSIKPENWAVLGQTISEMLMPAPGVGSDFDWRAANAFKQGRPGDYLPYVIKMAQRCIRLTYNGAERDRAHSLLETLRNYGLHDGPIPVI